MPSLSKISFKLLRIVSYLVLVMLAVFVTLSLLLVFYVSPRLDQWREPIQEVVQKHTEMPVEFGGLELSWRGFNPQLIVKDISFQESELPTPTKRLPRASIKDLRLSLQPSLTFWKDGLIGVELAHAQLPVLIDPEGDVWVGQHRLPLVDVSFNEFPDAKGHELNDVSFIAALSNYLTQDFGEQIDLLREDKLFSLLRRLSVEDVLLSIRDASNLPTGAFLSESEQQAQESRGVIYDFTLNVKKATTTISEGQIKSDVLLRSEALSANDIVIDNLIDYTYQDERGGSKPSGYLKVSSRFIEPRQLFADALDKLAIDKVVVEAFDFFSQLDDGHWQAFKADLLLGDFSMPHAMAERISLSAEGEVADVLATLFDYGHQHNPLQFTVEINDGWLYEPLNFRHDFALAHVELQGSYELDDANLPVLSVRKLAVNDPNIKLNAHGKWHAVPTTESGHIQLEGEIHHLVASYLPRFLPKLIDARALDWLDGAFINGTLHNGRFLVDGLADHYPYGQYPESGVNKIVADFKNFSLDFHHQAENDKWPVLEMEQGTFQFINDDILIDANRGWMTDSAGEKSIHYDNLQATISSLEKESVLTIDANAETAAEKFLHLMKETPLSALLSHALDESEAKGDLRASLTIGIPLDDMDSSTISGNLYTHDAEFKLNPSFPLASAVSGSLSFNEKYLTINQLEAQLVGGPVEVSGDIGRPGHSLHMTGQFSGEGIHDYFALKGLQQIKGQTPYHLEIKFLENNAFDAQLKSNLQGLAIDYPTLYTKTAKENVPLSVQWQRQRQRTGAYDDQLLVNYGKGSAQFNAEFSSGENQELLFKRGAIAFNEKPLLPERGLFFHGSINELDIESLTHWIDNFGFGEGESGHQLVNGFDVHAEKILLGGFELPDVRAKSQLESFKTIPLTLSGPTVKGRLVLTKSANEIGFYDVDADFNHLHWRVNHKSDDLYADDSESINKNRISSIATTPWKINQLGLQVKDLRFYNYHFKHVEARGEAEDLINWRLDKLAIQDEGGHLYGAAYVRNKNDKLIADLNFNINTIDMNGLLTTLAIGEDLLTGQGDIQGGVQIHDILNFEPDDLEINALGILNDGYINNVGNGATKLLSLLSLQALSKLPEMNKIFINQGTNSMNYSYLRFHLGLKEGRLWLPDFRLDSPLIALVAQGQGNLRTDAIDLDVVAVPRLDMSGAAVLTGVLVNPAVGVAAFLSQWLLRSPMEQGLTQRFKVGGKLDEIEINGVPVEMGKGTEAEGSKMPRIQMPEAMIDLVPEEQTKAPVPIIIEPGASETDKVESATMN